MQKCKNNAADLILLSLHRLFFLHKLQKSVLDQKNNPAQGKEKPTFPAKIVFVKSAIHAGKYPLHFT